MQVKINGEFKIVEDNINVHNLLLSYKLKPEVTAVEKNGIIINKEKYLQENLEENDVLELVRYMGGG